ncbi:protein NLRC5-like [Acanthaster planci]|uniref:Protein NLRC5-like n=1 Tax=Acanthaster planci TaxID=133434 RepID=A0A8B7YMZ4_ACAPL|nr:protein NLRC5-like [Acanthaster planci]
MVFLLKMHYVEQASDLIGAVFDQLIAENIAKHIDKGALQSYIEKNADKVLILLDGFDELKTTSLSESSFGSILKLLSRKSYRGCTVLVSTRPSHYDRLVTKELVQEPFTHVTVLGFNNKDMRDYAKRYYSDEPDKAEGLLERIESSNLLSTLALSPMLLLLMCLLWRDRSTLPETMSRLYQDAIEYIAHRKKVSEEEMSRVVIALGKVGLRGLLASDQELTFKESDFEQNLSTALKVGILTRQRVCKRLKPYNSVQFIHKTFQEFSAAAYLHDMFKGSKEEFQRTLNEIMSKDPLDFEYLLRFCCGHNEACTFKILKVFQERHQKDLSFDSNVGQLALHCYFEGQCECLPPKEFIDSFLTDDISIHSDNFNSDICNSIKYFVQCIAELAKDSGNTDIVKEGRVEIRVEWDESNVIEALSGLPNLVTLDLSVFILCGTVALWCKQLGQCKAVQHLHLRGCRLNGQDMVHVAESLRGLPNLATLNLSGLKLNRKAALWSKHLGQCKALQHLHLRRCSLNGKDMVRVAESLRGLPNLVTLNLSGIKLDGKAALWSKHLGQCKALQHLDLSCCKLNGKHMVHVAESLRGLPNLVTLDLSGNNLGCKGALWSMHLGQCKALQHLDLSCCSSIKQEMVHVGESLSGLTNLVTFKLSRNYLGGTVASWFNHLRQCKALQDVDLSDCSLNEQDVLHVAESPSGLPNLVTLNLSRIYLGGTAASWCKQLGQCKALQNLNLIECFLNGQDMVHIAESLRGLSNPVRLDLTGNDLGGRAASWGKQLGKCKALQHLDLISCRLNGQGMVHVAESLTGLPNLVRLNVSRNDLYGTAALWCKQLGQCNALEDLDLSGCELNGQDMVHVAESLSCLPNLVTLRLWGNDLYGTAESWCKQLGQCEALQDLDLSYCSLNGQDMVHVAESLCGLPNLVRLNLSENDVASKAALFCAELKKFKALEYLMLRDLEVTEEEKRHINELLAETNIDVD